MGKFSKKAMNISNKVHNTTAKHKTDKNIKDIQRKIKKENNHVKAFGIVKKSKQNYHQQTLS